MIKIFTIVLLIFCLLFSVESFSKNENRNLGVISISVANIRSRPGHHKELSDQVLLGTTVSIIKKKGDWFFIRTPYNYTGWIDEGVVVEMDSAGFSEWDKKEKIIYTNFFGFVYSSPDDQSQTLSDIVKGNIISLLGEVSDYYKILFPDEREGYIKKTESSRYTYWLRNLQHNNDQLLKTAKSFIGFPYLWGGTSIKGVDCSGFTKSVFYLNGIVIPRDAYQQADIGELVTDRLDIDKMQPGDLLFFGRKACGKTKEKVKHVAIYIGDGEYIHSSGKVKINSFIKAKENFNEYRFNSFLKAKRVLSSLDKNGVTLINVKQTYPGKKS